MTSRRTGFLLTAGMLLGLFSELPQATAHQGLHRQIEALSRRIGSSPREPALYLRRGELYRRHGDWSEALADFDHAQKLAPELVDVEFHKGRLLLSAGKPKEAKESLDRFLAVKRHHILALVTRARARVKLGEFLAAARDYGTATARLRDGGQKARPEYYLECARALQAAGEIHVDAAARCLDEGIRCLGPLPSLQNAAIRLELLRKRYDAALRRLDQTFGKQARKENWLARRADILAEAGRDAEARAALEAAITALDLLPVHRRQTRAVSRLRAKLLSTLER